MVYIPKIAALWVRLSSPQILPMSDSLGLPLPLIQAAIDSFMGMILVQTLLTGAYIVIFWHAIAPLVKDGKHKIYTGVLVLLFAMVITNLAGQWKVARSVLVVHNESRDTMMLDLLTGSVALVDAANASGCIAIVIADSLLCWRCYTLWQKNKWMLGVFAAPLLGEVALIPILLVLNVRVGPAQVSVICLFFFISSGITVLATALITYRIIDVSQNSNGQARSRYQFIIEILVESGVIYSATLLITGVLLAVGGNIAVPNHSVALTQAASYWGGIVTPVTGIASTLIALRISSGTARDARQWTQPVTGISFRRRHTGKDFLLSTLNGTSVSVSKFSTTGVKSRGETSYAGKKASD
ncbi:hypothetical protein D9619_008857 [Psilocybe cf. subviscida]|uniref:Uncharacterized protein n=1 Tax=Psilocybe cf. subviscida TaxID=2480587 RepID=A0A8H5F0X4_9AGAR|nr:hypothetical protein D9619_008857 [Psilocybe cf. subviscida]